MVWFSTSPYISYQTNICLQQWMKASLLCLNVIFKKIFFGNYQMLLYVIKVYV